MIMIGHIFMKKTIFSIVSACCISQANAAAISKTIRVDSPHDSRTTDVTIKVGDRHGPIEFYENEKLIGTYRNLTVNETSLSSGVLPLAGKGLALVIDSNGSRNKFHIVAPINRSGKKFYVNCAYKIAYDAVDDLLSVGTSCNKTELSKIDVSTMINQDGMTLYSDKPKWLKTVPHPACPNAVGLNYGAYRIARCSAGGASDSKDQIIKIFNKNGSLIFSVSGYEFIPKTNGSHFSLLTDLKDQSVIFDGNIQCFYKNNGTAASSRWTGKISNRLTINYTISKINGCLKVDRSYIRKKVNASLNGYSNGNLFYLLETDERNASTGLFILNQLSDNFHGVWVGVPPKDALTVN
ncbi:hypothetical protein ACAX43_21435 [Paraburkholderia sp. IW21]|uniref:hypothetical protein n=1 Tax=Paraburkholderia sp. IW21 TaxID=3242488 RepID=UPI00352029D9